MLYNNVLNLLPNLSKTINVTQLLLVFAAVIAVYSKIYINLFKTKPLASQAEYPADERGFFISILLMDFFPPPQDDNKQISVPDTGYSAIQH